MPSLSLRRWIRNPGSLLSIRKQERPASVWASVRKMSQEGYEQNHLWPVISQAPSPAGSARVLLARTSEPPCFSVIAMPDRAPSS